MGIRGSTLRGWQDAFLTYALIGQCEHVDRTLSQPDERLQKTLEVSRIEQGCVKIEITESEMMDNPNPASHALHRLRVQHIATCLDDFGIGYSSLSHLQRLPITYLKIDQAFVRRLRSEDDALAIVKTIVALAHHLGRKVIAEGIGKLPTIWPCSDRSDASMVRAICSLRRCRPIRWWHC